MHDVKELAHLTNAYISKESDVSIKTIERIMAINIEQDIMRATARRIELVVIGPVRDYSCCLDHEVNDVESVRKLLADVETENEQLKAQLRQIDEQHRQDIRAVRNEYQEQITFLMDELKAWRSLHHNGQ